MEPKVNYVLVGSFVLVLGAALLAGILWLGKTDYRGVYDRYEATMRESVAGLSVDSTVKYRGVDVGRVKAIALAGLKRHDDLPDVPTLAEQGLAEIEVRSSLPLLGQKDLPDDIVARLNKAMEDQHSRILFAKQKIAEATAAGNGELLTSAQEMWFEARRNAEALENIKKKATAPRPQRTSPSYSLGYTRPFSGRGYTSWPW